jgi:hypothetical protein
VGALMKLTYKLTFEVNEEYLNRTFEDLEDRQRFKVEVDEAIDFILTNDIKSVLVQEFSMPEVEFTWKKV